MGYGSRIALRSDMLEHADGDDFVESAFGVLSCVVNLLRGDIVAGDVTAVVLGGVVCKSSPAAAEVQHFVCGLELQLAADEFTFCLLRLIQCPCVLPVCASVDHAFIQHVCVELVAEVVVTLCDSLRSGLVLHVQSSSSHPWPQPLPSKLVARFQPRAKHSGKELIELLHIPPVHVRLA